LTKEGPSGIDTAKSSLPYGGDVYFPQYLHDTRRTGAVAKELYDDEAL
jgi:hypothetical protein